MFFYEICKIFKSTYFEENLRMAASNFCSNTIFCYNFPTFAPFVNLSIRVFSAG